MKFSISKQELLDRLSLVSRAVSTRSSIQALAGIRIRTGNGTIELSATDMEIGLVVSSAATIDEAGQAVVPGRLLHDVIKQLPAGEVEISYRPEQRDVAIEAGHASFAIKTLPVDDFPELPVGEGETITLPAKEFVETVNRVARSASRDETRPHLTGILVSADGSELRMVATDSYRLSVKQTKLGTALEKGFEANIPARTLQELTRFASEGELAITMRERQIVFSIDGIRMTSRLVEGQFPNYKQLLPDSFEHKLEIETEELLEAVRRVSLLAQRNTPLRLRFAEGDLTISAQTPDVGEARETIPLNGFTGEPLEIGFNADFLRDGLESAEASHVILKLISPFRPGTIESGDESEFLYLVMPIRLNV